MSYFCSDCGTTADVQADCQTCGHSMKMVSLGSSFILDVIDLAASSIADELVVYERRGPFVSVPRAMEWWTRHERLQRYFGCTVSVEELMAPTESAQLVTKNWEN